MNAPKKYATMINDVELLIKIRNKITNCQPIAYHRLCSVLYQRHAEKLLNNKNTEWHKNRHMHEEAFRKLCIFIRDNVIIKKKCYLMTFVRQLFVNLLIDEYEETGIIDNVDIFDTYHIPKKIFSQKMFKSKIRRIRCGDRLLLAPHDVSVINNLHEIQSDSVLQTAALQIRSQILKIDKRKLSRDITTEDLTRGECEIPKSLIQFFQTVLSGCNYRRKKNPKTELRVDSIVSDLIYATTNGKIMPSKHITLGITLKSLTSSKKVLSLINKLGHCICYNVVEELETEASYTSVGRSELCPSNVNLRGDLHTGVAFDNFDRFVETIDGKDTLHDTVGIIYQDVCEDVEQQNRVAADDTDCTRKRRRTFDTIIPDIEPFSKRLKSIGGLLPVNFSSRSDIPSNLKKIKMIDAAWLISHVKNITTPMWVGFNAKIKNDSSTKQIVSYLPTINSSPTDVAVVVETMKRAIKIADECNQTYIQVTYDLAIAKIALQVQSMQNDDFARLFIHLGPFHIQMSFLKAVGTFISSCGLTTVMVDSGLLAAGSVGGFLSAKNFSRAKRLHVLVSLALNMEHFKFFMASEGIEIDEGVTAYLNNLQSNGLTDGVIDNAELREIIVKYQCFKEKTLTGQHGKTAQYYIMYTNLIEHFLMLSRSIRTGDFSLFKYVLPKMNNLLFPLNHVNYARWLLRYHDNLMKVDDTHPGLSEDLAAGYFGIKRTNKSFSRQPIDLVTEQTINADAGRTLTGISHFTNSIQARLRYE